MKYEGAELEKKAASAVAELMVMAAKTAPKGRGTDSVVSLVIDGNEKNALCEEMRKIAEKTGQVFFERDAGNIENSHLVVLIGGRDISIGLIGCGFCGFKDCAEKKSAGGRCAFSMTDLGIAIGSAVSVASNNRVDNRVMFSAGRAALNLKLFPEDVKICYGIPLSSSSKSIFFDRG